MAPAVGIVSHRRSARVLLAILPGLLSCSSSSPSASNAGQSRPDASMEGGTVGSTLVVTGPITGGIMGKPFTTAAVDLAAAGYVEEEYFIESDATAYAWVTPPGMDGQWSVKPASTAHYKTRMLVRRPTDATRFNGTVVVEWLNVSGGVDADPDFAFAHVELLRDGFAYVGVSAQAEGVVGGGFSLVPGQAVPLVKWDPQRYGSLKHPGDAYSYDIFSQATRALRSPGASVHPLGALQPARFLATGESQSAFRMVTYTDAIQPIDKLFDGIFIHSRAAGGAPLTVSDNAGSTAGLTGGPAVALIRGDLGVPVFQFLTETDVLGLAAGIAGFSSARQPDTDHLRSWEVAGTSHADAYLLSASAAPAGTEPDAGADAGANLGCTGINAGPQHWVLDGAFAAVQAWLKSGTAPAHGDPLVLADAGSGLAKDAVGNTLGGVRTAAVDVPIAVYSGQSAAASIVCSLFGSTVPLPPDKLMSLYPTHDDYVAKVMAATTMAQQAGFLVAADVPLIVQEAQSAPVPN
jgi:hypothetical protein